MNQITFRLKPGQLLREEIEDRIKKQDVKAGVLLSVVGGLENIVLRMAGATPENQSVKKLDGPFEIVSGTGTISQNGCHIHISVSDKNGVVVGGHLKHGCKIAPTAEIVIGIFETAAYQRIYDEETGFKELVVG